MKAPKRIKAPRIPNTIKKRTKKQTYEQWERETLAYAPDYYTIENDYDDDVDLM